MHGCAYFASTQRTRQLPLIQCSAPAISKTHARHFGMPRREHGRLGLPGDDGRGGRYYHSAYFAHDVGAVIEAKTLFH